MTTTQTDRQRVATALLETTSVFRVIAWAEIDLLNRVRQGAELTTGTEEHNLFVSLETQFSREIGEWERGNG